MTRDGARKDSATARTTLRCDRRTLSGWADARRCARSPHRWSPSSRASRVCTCWPGPAGAELGTGNRGRPDVGASQLLLQAACLCLVMERIPRSQRRWPHKRVAVAAASSMVEWTVVPVLRIRQNLRAASSESQLRRTRTVEPNRGRTRAWKAAFASPRTPGEQAAVTAASESEQLRCESVLSPISAEKLCPLTLLRWFRDKGSVPGSRFLEFNFMISESVTRNSQPRLQRDPSSAGSAQHGSQARSQGVE